VLTVGGDNTSTIFDGQIVPMAGATGGTLKKIGAGTFRFQGVNACTNATIVDGGKFVLDGRLAGGVTVTANGALAGSGQINGTVSNSGTLAPALTTNRAAVLTVNAADGLTLAANSVLRLNIQSASQYDRIRVNGPVVIDGATLQVNLLYEPAPTDVFYLVLNGSAGGTTGAFAGIPADEAVALGNDYSGKISYAGTGDATANNDVKLYEVGKGKRGTFIFFR
jgi:hypothetical protein